MYVTIATDNKKHSLKETGTNKTGTHTVLRIQSNLCLGFRWRSVPNHLIFRCCVLVWQLLMCGTGNISVSDFRQHHTVIHSAAPFSKVNVMLYVQFQRLQGERNVSKVV